MPSSHRRLRAAAVLVLVAALTGAVLAVPIAAATTLGHRLADLPRADRAHAAGRRDRHDRRHDGRPGRRRRHRPAADRRADDGPDRLLRPRRRRHDRPDPRLRPVRDDRRRRDTWQNPHRRAGHHRRSDRAGIDLDLPRRPGDAAGDRSRGTIVPPDGDGARTRRRSSIAALIKVETGTLVARQVRPITGPGRPRASRSGTTRR